MNLLDDTKKLKKLSLIILAIGLFFGICVIVITLVCSNNDKKRYKNNIFHHILDKADEYKDDYEYGEIYDDASRYMNKVLDTMDNVHNSLKYRPFYFIGGFIIFISCGLSATLFIIAKSKEKQLNKQ